MAQKESHHRETVDAMKSEIDKVKRDHAGVVKLSRDQVRVSPQHLVMLCRFNLTSCASPYLRLSTYPPSSTVFAIRC